MKEDMQAKDLIKDGSINTNFYGKCIGIFLLLIIKIHMNIQGKGKGFLDARILRVMINLTMFQCFFDSFVFWVDGKQFIGARELNYIGNIVYYILNITISFFWPLFTEYKLSSNYKKVKKLAAILAIPYMMCALLVISAPFNGIVFTVNEDNIYSRTGFYFAIPTILIFIYVICGTVNVYLKRKKGGEYMLFPVIYFVTPITIAMIVQMLMYGISLIFIGIAIAITGVYLSTQNESAYIDRLCGVYNRRYYDDYLRAFCNAKKKGIEITGVLIDMDNFKAINDNFGHHVGDEALRVFSSVLREEMHSVGFAIRYGGDEFILLSEKPLSVMEEVISRIKQRMNELNASKEQEYCLAFSYGATTLKSDSSSDDFLKQMDKYMYEMKRERKADR